MSRRTRFALLTMLLSASFSLDAANNSKQILNDIKDIHTFVDAQFDGHPSTLIDHLPFVIDSSGSYSVATDLVYSGEDAAITINADRVYIDFNHHSLLLTNPNSQGLLARGMHTLQVANCTICCPELFKTEKSAAIQLEGVQNASFDCCNTKNSTKGFFLRNSNDIAITHANIESHEGTIEVVFPSPATLAGTGNGAGVWIDSSSNVSIDGSYFLGASLPFDPTRSSFAFHAEGNSKNISLSNSTFSNWIGTLHVVEVDSMVVDGCMLASSPVSNFNLIQLGDCEEGSHANNVTVRNSTCIQTAPIQGFDGILLLGGSGYLFENLIIDTKSSDIANGYMPAAMHIGYPYCDTVSKVRVKGCQILGANGRMVSIENGRTVLFDDCRISGATDVNVSITMGTNVTIKNSMIFNGNSGILIDSEGPATTSIMDCLVFDNTHYGIHVADHNANHLSGNAVWGGKIGIYLDYPNSSETYSNMACANSVSSCFNVTSIQAPGARPEIAGSNICASP